MLLHSDTVPMLWRLLITRDLIGVNVVWRLVVEGRCTHPGLDVEQASEDSAVSNAQSMCDSMIA